MRSASMPKGRLFPLTIDELVEGAALLRAIKRGDLDRTPQPAAPLDILAQQIVAACVAAGEEGWPEDALFESFRRAWPYRDLKREDFDAVIQMHLNGRRGLLHRDGVGGRIMARKRAPDHGHHRRRRDSRRRRLSGPPAARRIRSSARSTKISPSRRTSATSFSLATPPGAF